MVKILYNNVDIFDGISATPYVSTQDTIVDYGQRWGVATAFNLVGTITGDACTDYYGLLVKQQELSLRLLNDYKPFVIRQGNDTLFSGNFTVIKSINYSESLYTSLVPYDISILVYDPNLFSGQYGVLDPSNNYSYNKNKDGTISLVHEIKARGFNTGSAALQNARDFVIGLTGLSNKVEPLFNAYCDSSNGFNLESFSETINPYAASYEVREEYLQSTKNTQGNPLGGSLLYHTTSFDYDFVGGVTTVNVEGYLRGSYTSSIDHSDEHIITNALRQKLSYFDPYATAVKAYSSSYGGTSVKLNDFYNTKVISESATDNKISFNYSYTDESSYLTSSNQVTNNYSVNIEYDALSEITTVSLNSSLSTHGLRSARYNIVKDYYENNFDGYSLATNEYNSSTYFSEQFSLNPIPLTESLSADEVNGTISYTATWTNKRLFPEPFKSLDYTVSVIPPLPQFASYKKLDDNGNYIVLDLGWSTRAQITIQGQGTMKLGSLFSDGRTTIVSIINDMVNQFGSADFIHSQEITQESPVQLSFAASFSYYGDSNYIT